MHLLCEMVCIFVLHRLIQTSVVQSEYVRVDRINGYASVVIEVELYVTFLFVDMYQATMYYDPHCASHVIFFVFVLTS